MNSLQSPPLTTDDPRSYDLARAKVGGCHTFDGSGGNSNAQPRVKPAAAGREANLSASPAVDSLPAQHGITGSIAPKDMDALLTPEEFAAWAQMSVRWAVEQARGEKVPAVRVGGEWRFHPRTVLAKCGRGTR